MTDDDLKRKDDHLTAAAAVVLMECGIEVDITSDLDVSLDLRACGLPQIGLDAVSMSPYQAILLAAALVEVATRAERQRQEVRRG